MKEVSSVIIGLILASSLQATACPRSANQLICPGDLIVADEDLVGTVLGVNRFQDTVAFRSHASGKTYTRHKHSLALGVGCLEMYCVGDRVVSSDSKNNIVGTILAVNPYQDTIALQSSVTGKVYTRSLEFLSLGVGCVRGVCVNDTIISSDNIEGTVLGVNPFQDGVAFQSKASGKVYTREVTTLSSAEYNDTYGQSARNQNRYPNINEKAYIEENLKFSLQRPQLP